jgi:hypothetical protein
VQGAAHLLRGMPPLAAFADHKDIRNALLALAPRYDFFVR